MTCQDKDEGDSSFLCGDCSFQAMNRYQLLEHLEKKHDKHTCNSCNIACNSNNALNKHIKDHHKSHTPCRDYVSNSCDYDSDCKYNHIKLQENEHICYTCGEQTFIIKDLMSHIKETLGSQPCTKYAKRQCNRKNRCWYTHGKSPLKMWSIVVQPKLLPHQL